ncbi:MAG: SNF2-related protein [Cyanobacteria bacterium]|nr:SNF2-related protein [Cyanobacteriota bacterium]
MSGLRDHQWRRRFSSSIESLLEGFYRPALMDASRYWRITGYFTSRSLLQVLEGVEQLVAASPDGLGHGQMRLITGVFLSEDDITALAAGTPAETVLTDHLLNHFPFKGVTPGDQGAAALGAELLAWLVDNGHLEIRVGLPLIDGLIVNDGAIFHAKEGVIETTTGSILASAAASTKPPTAGPATSKLSRPSAPGSLAALRPSTSWKQASCGSGKTKTPAPAPSPFLKDLPSPEPEPVVEIVPDIDERRRIVWSYVLQAAASDLPGAERVGEGTSAVSPWPHQQRAFQRLWHQWPPRLLIADEVGLGKTVQAGLVLRQAWLSGRARRMLVMAPASVLNQWQRELREKFGLDWPIYSGKSLDWQSTCFRPKGESQPVSRDAWTAEPFVLVSSHLVRRRDRQRELLEAEPYDLVVLDEAHHARTRRENSSSGGERLRPNTLMQLMQQLRQLTNGLLLLTATPMQVSELEVWDLLALLGMPPEWTEDAFERFFEWVEKENPDEATLSYLAGLWRSSVSAFGEAPGTAMPEALRKSPLRKRKALRALNDTDPLSRRNLSIEIRQATLALAKRWTPVQGLISRHSRNLLRSYKQQGSMDLAIGNRHVDDRFLEST